MILRLLTALFLLLATTATAQEEKPGIQIGLSEEVVEISSSFSGTEIIIFGSIENGIAEDLKAGLYDVVVVLEGPRELVTVRRRERKMGIWVNGTARDFIDVPSSYSVASTKPFSQITDAEDARILQIGLENLSFRPVDGGIGDPLNAEFAASVKRLKTDKDLYLERPGGISFLTPSLFKARLAVPANVPIGRHTARAFMFHKGKFVESQFLPLTVKKIGFEQFTYDFAHQYGFWFGIICVIVAAFTGWLASVVFRKN
ncbi:MAG: TIGR02186 family protein [Pseudomonadota bacterium]